MTAFLQRDRETGAFNPWLIALTVMLSTFMEVLDTSVANVSLQHIAGSLSSTVDESTWVLTSYLVSNAIVLPLTGWFSKLFGQKRFYMACVVIFTLSSLLCGLAPSLGMLVFFRVLQGAGGGGLQPVSQAILVQSFPKEKRGMAMAVYGMGVIFAPIVGPTLGGWITDSYSWRWIFLINIPIGVLSLVLTSLLIFDPPYLERKKFSEEKIDYIGLGLLSVGLGFLQVVLDKGQTEDWFGSRFIVWGIVAAVVGLIGAALWEWHSRNPVVDLHLLGERNFMLSTVTMFLLGLVLYGSTALLPIFLQTLLGYSATTSGLVLSPGGVAVLLLLPVVGVLTSHIEARWLVTVGSLIISASLFHMAGFNLNISFSDAMWARVYQSMGMAFLFVPINVMAFHFVKREKVNNATGIMNLARNVGGSVGIAFVTTGLSRRVQVHQNILAGHVNPFSGAYQQMMSGATAALTTRGSDPVQAAAQAHGLVYGLLQRQAAMMAFVDDFWILGAVFMCLVPLMFLMKKTRPHKTAEIAN
jgi:DHA2 family multidrug resistance protein